MRLVVGNPQTLTLRAHSQAPHIGKAGGGQQRRGRWMPLDITLLIYGMGQLSCSCVLLTYQ